MESALGKCVQSATDTWSVFGSNPGRSKINKLLKRFLLPPEFFAPLFADKINM